MRVGDGFLSLMKVAHLMCHPVNGCRWLCSRARCRRSGHWRCCRGLRGLSLNELLHALELWRVYVCPLVFGLVSVLALGAVVSFLAATIAAILQLCEGQFHGIIRRRGVARIVWRSMR
eukprot:scaffold1432_cov151-Amphora_coffeaeformis.AAC.1